MARSQDLPLFERHIQASLSGELSDADAQAAVFNLDYAAMDVLTTLEHLALRPHDLTHAGYVMLMALWITGPRETRELATVLRVTKGAVVGAVNTLERRGLVRRVRSVKDRRLVSIELTSEGRALIPRVLKDWHALEVEVTEPLTVAEKRMLADLCRKIAGSAANVRRRHGVISALPDPAGFLTEQTMSTNGASAKR